MPFKEWGDEAMHKRLGKVMLRTRFFLNGGKLKWA